MELEDYSYTPDEVAEIFKVSTATIRKNMKEGNIEYFNFCGSSAMPRITKEEVKRLMNQKTL